MYVLVDDDRVSLEEADDFTRFHVVCEHDADVSSALQAAGWGTADPDGDAYISVDALRTAGRSAGGSDWQDGFEKMLAYAQSKGWLDEAGTAIQAHVEHK